MDCLVASPENFSAILSRAPRNDAVKVASNRAC
jgi:hypothetical protein